VITHGGAEALSMLTAVLRAHGHDAIGMEDPGHPGQANLLREHGLRPVPVPVDCDGLVVSALPSSVRAVVVTAAHQFPLGTTLHPARRHALLAWAREHDGVIIEDDYDAEHRYDRPPVPALRSVLPEHVFYAGSVSKLLAPALRLGWVLAPPKYREALVDAKRFADLGNAALPQLVLARLMESGALERHLRHLRRQHRRRRDAMIDAVGAHLPGATVHGAAAGLHLTVTFRAGFADTDLAALALARGVKAHPLSWHSQRPRRPGLVLGYAASTPTDIGEGVAVLGDVLRHLP
jgi:GntR family transcriptional regulator/MocR family aminotransferase